jgi:LAS superfamily LD-carboxypeptidase LdcB
VNLVPIDDKGHKLEEKAAAAFRAMNAAAWAELHLELPVNVAARSRKRQEELYAAWEKGGKDPAHPVAKPGESEHDEENGAHAVDINQASDARILPWLCRRAPSFGFYATASREKHHWAWYAKRPPLHLYVRHLSNLRSWSG